ncbi:MAG: nicotinate phosphoribosyltransferase, partial [Proteobacteria bacterium]|nr:nicotinate phosphoribosyltransferase [Pseudomonadota bacterium]
YKTNQKGYKVLPDFIRVIQGDGMNQITITRLIDRAIARGLSVDNFAMGMGAGLLQNINRDTMNYAMKANAVMIDGVWHDVFKNPITAPEKSSKKGRLALVERGGGFVTVGERTVKKGEQNILRPVYRNGELLIDEDFDTIKARADI